MKTACRVMYILGTIFNIVALVLALLGIAGGVTYLVIPDKIAAEQGIAVEVVKQTGMSALIAAIVWTVIELLVLIFALIARKAINNKKKDIWPHVVMIVVGAIGDLFFLLGGIFGLVAESQENGRR